MSSEQIDACAEVVTRFGDMTALEVQTHVMSALVNEGSYLLECGRCEDALRIADDVLVRLSGRAIRSARTDRPGVEQQGGRAH
jgi:hypothetical protein